MGLHFGKALECFFQLAYSLRMGIYYFQLTNASHIAKYLHTMKARLDNNSQEDRMMMTDLTAGQVAVVMGERDDTGYGEVVLAFPEGSALGVITIGQACPWALENCKQVPVRLLKAGDKIVLGE